MPAAPDSLDHVQTKAKFNLHLFVPYSFCLVLSRHVLFCAFQSHVLSRSVLPHPGLSFSTPSYSVDLVLSHVFPYPMNHIIPSCHIPSRPALSRHVPPCPVPVPVGCSDRRRHCAPAAPFPPLGVGVICRSARRAGVPPSVSVTADGPPVRRHLRCGVRRHLPAL